MAVFVDDVVGTIGGGHLELQAINEARARLGLHLDPHAVPDLDLRPEEGLGLPVLRYALGPSLGQCCGGEVMLRYALVQAGDIARLQVELGGPRQPLALFGGGHVGKALIRALSPLPIQVRWVDSRDEIFPVDVPPHVQCEHSDPVQGAVAALAPGALVLIMSFSHAEDLDVVAACLLRQRLHGDLPFVGLIGSKTKWATFRHRLLARGFSEAELAHITCPIGIPGITGKAPEVIAVAVVAQLLLFVSPQPLMNTKP